MDRLACSGINQIIVLIECKPLKGNSHFPGFTKLPRSIVLLGRLIRFFFSMRLTPIPNCPDERHHPRQKT